MEGTTSVKIVLLDPTSNFVVFQSSKETKAGVQLLDSKKDEQNVKKIFDTIEALMLQFPYEKLAHVGFIGVSGQMHGVVLWKAQEAWKWSEEGAVSLDEAALTNLVTWQDSRCTPEFLSTLPLPDSHLGVHTGFGIPTVFWLQRNDPRSIEGFDSSGTIHDLLVTILINNLGKPCISPQNAASWGYFDTSHGSWNLENLKQADFPIELLPVIKPAGAIAGSLYADWNGIPKGCKIGVALGDLQASIYSTLFDKPGNNAAVINISTSLQIAFVMPSGFQPPKNKDKAIKTGGVEYFPYFNNTYLAVAAALTGGNCLASFVTMLHNFIQELGLEINPDKIWESILSSGALLESTDLQIQPTFQGERSDPQKRASVSNIHPGNLKVSHFTRALCRGVISNAEELMPQDFLLQHGIQIIYGTGSALQKNPIFQQELERIFNNLQISISQGGDSALGAAAYGKVLLGL
ncbi:unnamed protein product [Allacma fusca]|uniref:Carbohydrate kinase FGGY N-terminal domain-containing protein n=1 Tax=Allacma fusca TaxID=39272 RepID=A0A8J2J4E8_9HEXA|nr:unnamed protein product [Allacma fusca]